VTVFETQQCATHLHSKTYSFISHHARDGVWFVKPTALDTHSGARSGGGVVSGALRDKSNQIARVVCGTAVMQQFVGGKHRGEMRVVRFHRQI
jgi:hypothetical protein